MTTLAEKTESCAVCGKTSKHMVVNSTNTLEAPDLDTRPAEMMRSTIHMWVQTCPSCGYCAPDISEHIEGSSEVVRGDSYQQQLDNPEFTKLANAFLCYSLIEESLDNYASAAWAIIRAAWELDDVGYDAGARECRKKAVTFLQKLKENGHNFAEQTGAEEALMVDLYRRSGQFELALRTCDDGLKKNPEGITADVLRFQEKLIGKSDVDCHTITEATGEHG